MLQLHRDVGWAAMAVLALAIAAQASEARDQLWAAVRNGDVKVAKELIEQGVNVNAANTASAAFLAIYAL